MSGPSYPGGYPGDPNSPPGYPQYPQPQQPPPYQPPPYQPPVYQPPVYQPPVYPPPQKSEVGRVFLIIGIVLGVLIIACVGFCSVMGLGLNFAGTAISTRVSQFSTQVATQVTGDNVLMTVTSFCQAETAQNYSTAYQQLSPSLQQQYSQSQFTQDSQRHDSTGGVIAECGQTGGTAGAITISGTTATLSVSVTRSLTATPGTATSTGAIGQMTLTEDSTGTWTISSIDSSLNLL